MLTEIRKFLRDHYTHPTPHPTFQFQHLSDCIRTIGRGNTEFENGIFWAEASDRAEWERMIRREKQFFSEQGKSFEWKYLEMFQPAYVKDILLAEGFEPSQKEQQFVWEASMGVPAVSDQFVIEELEIPAQIGVIEKIQNEVWGMDFGWLRDEFCEEKAKRPDSIFFYAARVSSGEYVANGWIRLHGSVGTLHGGATLSPHRGKGAFTSLVAVRLERAKRSGARIVYVDAVPASAAILAKLGFTAVGETIPFIFKVG